jgi:hypothetical protein
VLPQAPYSPDLSPCDFHLFPNLKSRAKGYHFETLDRVQKAVTDAIKTLTELTSNPAVRRGKFAGPSVLHHRDIILKGTMLI